MRKALMPQYDMADMATLALANTVIEKLTGNSFYPTPKVSLATLQSVTSTYSTSLAKADKGSSVDKAQKNADKATLIGLLRDECDYVNDTAQDDVALISSGFNISKEPQPRVLGTPVISVENGVSGQLISSTPGVNASVIYKHRYTTDPTLPLWPDVTTTKATCKIDGLVPGTLYHMQIVSYGANGQVTYSDVITKMAV